MADKIINTTMLAYYDSEKKKVNATKTEVQTVADDLSALDAKVDEIISEGGEPNVIETVKVNGTALVPDANKAVDVTVPTATSELTNDGDGSSNFATEAYVQQNGGKIDVIQVNGTAQTITNKTVNITVPTKVSDLTNDSKYQTETEVQTAIDSAVASVYKPKGSVAFANLPALTKANVGNVYNVTDAFTTTADFVEGAGKEYPAGSNVVITNTSGTTYKYDVLAGIVDLSNYWDKTNYTIATAIDIDAILNA